MQKARGKKLRLGSEWGTNVKTGSRQIWGLLLKITLLIIFPPSIDFYFSFNHCKDIFQEIRYLNHIYFDKLRSQWPRFKSASELCAF